MVFVAVVNNLFEWILLPWARYRQKQALTRRMEQTRQTFVAHVEANDLTVPPADFGDLDAPPEEDFEKLWQWAEEQLLEADRAAFPGSVEQSDQKTETVSLRLKFGGTGLEIAGTVSPQPLVKLTDLYFRSASESETDFQDVLRIYREALIIAEAKPPNELEDYPLRMDMAMAEAILGIEDEQATSDAIAHLQRALELAPSLEALDTSRRAWESLRAYLPDRPSREEAQEIIQNAIEIINRAIEERAQKPPVQ